MPSTFTFTELPSSSPPGTSEPFESLPPSPVQMSHGATPTGGDTDMTNIPTPPSLESLAAALNEIRLENAALRSQNVELSRRIEEAGKQPPPSPPPPSRNPVAAPRQNMPMLSEFDGTRAAYRPWRQEVDLKLEIDGPLMAGEKGKIGAIFHALTGTAKAHMADAVSRLREKDDATAKELLDLIDANWGNPHQQRQALQKLGVLKQGARAFTTFYPEFERLLGEAGGHSWPEDVKIDKLLSSVSLDILEAMEAVEVPQQYTALVNLCRSIGERQYYIQQRRKKEAASGSRGKPTATSTFPVADAAPAGDAMDWEYTSPVRAARVNMNGHPTGPGLPSDVELKGRRAKWVSTEEYQRRRDAGVCLRCARRGCRVAVCPLAASKNPNRQPRIQVAELKVDDVSEPVEPAVEPEQGKE